MSKLTRRILIVVLGAWTFISATADFSSPTDQVVQCLETPDEQPLSYSCTKAIEESKSLTFIGWLTTFTGLLSAWFFGRLLADEFSPTILKWLKRKQ